MDKSKAKPILFNTDMVRAILDGRKTVTRRVIPEHIIDKYYDYDEWCNCVMPSDIHCVRAYEKQFFIDYTRYQKGDILYVRETWKPAKNGYFYKADWEKESIADITKWRPSIHMPKEAARIFLKVTDVRVERLQDITEEQAVKEGFNSRQEFISAILKMYPECTEDSWVFVYEFERVNFDEENA